MLNYVVGHKLVVEGLLHIDFMQKVSPTQKPTNRRILF